MPHRYFKDYHFMLPILDPSVTPNTFYQHAPFLFWVVVSIGSRRYTRQPTLTRALALPVTQLALQSIIVRSKPIERMKGLILLLNWPFPSGPFYHDPSFLLGGTLLHMAMHCGLHAPTFSQDFSKTYLKLSEQELIRRAEMWAYVVITYQRYTILNLTPQLPLLIVIIRTCSGSGQANLVSFEIYNEQIHFKTLLEKLPVTLRIQIQISNIIARAHKTLLDLGLLSMTPQQERTMDALLKGFNTELDSLENLASSSRDQVQDVIPYANFRSVWDRLYIASARQELVVMHFYKSATTLDMQSCMLIFNATSSVLEQVRDLDRDYGLHRICTRFLLTATLLSLASMARILKGPFAGYLDQIRGYNLFDTGARFARSCSIQKADFGERCAAFVEKIWKSNKVFRDPDGSINITLRVRNRLSGGPVHDTLRCWKEEFFDPEYMHCAPGMDIGTLFANPLVLSGKHVLANGGVETVIPSSATAGLDATLAPSSVPSGALSNFSAASEFLLNDELWGDLELGLSDNWDVAESSVSWMA
jgi:transcriptional regulatory protein LEU3